MVAELVRSMISNWCYLCMLATLCSKTAKGAMQQTILVSKSMFPYQNFAALLEVLTWTPTPNMPINLHSICNTFEKLVRISHCDLISILPYIAYYMTCTFLLPSGNGRLSSFGVILGFVVMMSLDVGLGWRTLYSLFIHEQSIWTVYISIYKDRHRCYKQLHRTCFCWY